MAILRTTRSDASALSVARTATAQLTSDATRTAARSPAWLKTLVVNYLSELSDLSGLFGCGTLNVLFLLCKCIIIIPAGKNTLCFSERHSSVCKCQPGFTGDVVAGCVPIDYCSQTPCAAGARCDNTRGSYKCSCPAGTVGEPYKYVLMPHIFFSFAFSFVLDFIANFFFFVSGRDASSPSSAERTRIAHRLPSADRSAESPSASTSALVSLVDPMPIAPLSTAKRLVRADRATRATALTVRWAVPAAR